MTAVLGDDLLHAQREMLVDGLRHVFGEFTEQALERILPRLQWVQLGGGEALFRQGTTDRSLYVVISGRLRAVALQAGSPVVLGEVARGETVGEMAFFTGEVRSATVTAVRDSVLVRFSDEAFRELLLADPLVSLNLTRLVVQRLQRASLQRSPVAKPVVIGLAAISDRVDLPAFARQLQERIAGYGRTSVITSQTIDALLGAPGAANALMADGERSRQVAQLLERIESEHEFLLVVADAAATGWTGRCLRHCDEILLVADADAPHALHAVEQAFLAQDAGAAAQVNRTLVLLHPETRRCPSGTARWFAGRQLAHHVHVRRERAADWGRLARVVTGNAVALVLSGGGARGFAHLGVLRALEEAGHTYDLVGGTSIGAVMGAYAAMDLPAQEAIALARQAFRANPTRDFNLLPLLSLIGGRRLRTVIDQAVVASCGEDIGIEDLWKGYFCISSNYSTATECVLDRGPLARSIRASVSIPGALPPVMLGGELHIDGGTFNNFPTDVMRRRGAARIIGVNLLRDRDVRYEFEEVPGTLSLLRDKLRGRGGHFRRLPSLTSLLLNTSMMHSYARQREAQAFADLYFAPEVHRFGMLEWSAFDRIVEAGWQHGQSVLGGGWRAAQAAAREALADQATLDSSLDGVI